MGNYVRDSTLGIYDHICNYPVPFALTIRTSLNKERFIPNVFSGSGYDAELGECPAEYLPGWPGWPWLERGNNPNDSSYK